mgnify:FL=1
MFNDRTGEWAHGVAEIRRERRPPPWASRRLARAGGAPRPGEDPVVVRLHGSAALVAMVAPRPAAARSVPPRPNRYCGFPHGGTDSAARGG